MLILLIDIQRSFWIIAHKLGFWSLLFNTDSSLVVDGADMAQKPLVYHSMQQVWVGVQNSQTNAATQPVF